jgi:hypothetical protein
MKQEKSIIEVGEFATVEFRQNRKALEKPIAILKGCVAFIHKNETAEPKVGETWLVAVSHVMENYVVIIPGKMLLTKEETEQEKIEKFIQEHKVDKTKKPKKVK